MPNQDNRRIGINIANSTVRLLKSKISENGHYGLKSTKCRDNCGTSQIHHNKWSGIYISDGKSDENEPRSTVTLRRNTIQGISKMGLRLHDPSDYRTTKLATRQYRKRF